MTFEEQLRHLLNRASMENGSDTPDFILAKYLSHCLDSFNTAVNARDTWYGKNEPQVIWGEPLRKTTAPYSHGENCKILLTACNECKKDFDEWKDVKLENPLKPPVIIGQKPEIRD